METTHPRSAKIESIPSWTKPVTPDVASFFSALALAGLENVWVRLSAQDQRDLLGCKPFGNCAIMSNGSEIEIFRSVCFGTDGESRTFSGAALAEQIAKGLTARPGVEGRLNK